jgi:hypothetical protein
MAYFLRREASPADAQGALRRGRSLDGYAYAGQCIRCHAFDVTMAWEPDQAEAVMALQGDELIIALEEALGGLVAFQEAPYAKTWPAACKHVREGAMPYVRLLPGLCALASLGDYDQDPTPADVLADLGGEWPTYAAQGDWVALYEGEECDEVDPEGWTLFRPTRLVWVVPA